MSKAKRVRRTARAGPRLQAGPTPLIAVLVAARAALSAAPAGHSEAERDRRHICAERMREDRNWKTHGVFRKHVPAQSTPHHAQEAGPGRAEAPSGQERRAGADRIVAETGEAGLRGEPATRKFRLLRSAASIGTPSSVTRPFLTRSFAASRS